MILKQLPKQFGIKNYLQNSKKPSKMGHLRLVSPRSHPNAQKKRVLNPGNSRLSHKKPMRKMGLEPTRRCQH